MANLSDGLRRKAGTISLLLALVFTGGWVHSLAIDDYYSVSIDDFVEIPVENLAIAGIAIEKHSLFLLSYRRPQFIYETTAATGEYVASIKDGVTEIRFVDLADLESQYQIGQQSSAQSPDIELDSSIRFGLGIEPLLKIPFWAMAIPLTLLSAYLLLAKSRPRRIQESTAEVPGCAIA